MPFDKPTLTELANRSASSFRANLKGSDAKLWPNNVAVSAKVMAGGVFEAFSYLDYISRQVNKSTAEGVFLERHAADYGLTRQNASYASGVVRFTGDPEQTVPDRLVLQRFDGWLYEVTAPGVTSGLGVVDLPVRALDPGKAGNAEPDVAMALATSLNRINSSAVVAADGIGLGADVESDENLRARLLFRLRNPPMGGAAHDYVIWVRNGVPGVTRVFVDPINAANGRQSVGVYFLMDDIYVDGIPQPADVAAVADVLERLQPAGAIVDVQAPSSLSIDIDITNLGPNTTSVRDAIRTELAEMFRRESRVATLTEPFTLYRSLIAEAISVATGERFHDLVAPAGNTVVPAGSVAVLGEVTFA